MLEGVFLFRALANAQRLGILHLLQRHGPLAVCEISARLPLSFRSTSKHLYRLLVVGLVK